MCTCMYVCTNEINNSKTVQSNQSESMPKRRKDPIQRKFKIPKANIYYSEKHPIQGSKLYMPSISFLKHL